MIDFKQNDIVQTDFEKMKDIFMDFSKQMNKKIEMNDMVVNQRINLIVKDLSAITYEVNEIKKASNSSDLMNRTSDQINQLQKDISSLKSNLKEIKKGETILPEFLQSFPQESGVDNRVTLLESDMKGLLNSKQSKTSYSEDITALKKRMESKVDSSVIEELMRHIATRDELQSLADSILRSNENANFVKVESTKNNDALSNLAIKKKIEEKIKMCRKECDMRVQNMELWLKNEIVALKSNTLEMISIAASQKEPLIECPTLKMMTSTDMDDKFAILCSEVSACKLAWQQSIRQPFYRSAQWVWKSGSLKQGTSSVPWNIETSNTGNLQFFCFLILDTENMLWEEDSAIIKIEEGGLYEISFAFFTKTKPSIQIIVNGESVMSAINSPSYVIHHSSGYMVSDNGCLEPGTVTGLSLVVNS